MLLRSVPLTVSLWAVFLAALRVTVAAPEGCVEPSDHAVEHAASEAAAWMVRSQRPDRSFMYDYDAASNASSADYNEVRHAGVTMALYQAGGRLHDARAFAAADRGLAWMEASLVRRDGWAALSPNKQTASLGASALMLVGLTERRLVSGDPRYDDLMHELARFIESLQKEDGSFARGYDFVGGQCEEGSSLYYPGESFWALALMHNAFPGEGWNTKAHRALAYIATKRDAAENERFMPFNDQWAAYGIAEVAHWGELTQSEVDYAHRLAGRFGYLVRAEAQLEGSAYGRLLRGDPARGASAGTWLEGLVALWRAGKFDPRLADLEDPLRERATCLAGLMVAHQTTSDQAGAYADPSKVEGAWLSDGETRMDDQQHPFSGLLYTVDLMRGTARREPLQASMASP